MDKKLWSVVVVLAAIAFLPSQAMAQPILLQRCNADTLDPAKAAIRLEWARKCGLTKNVGGPSNGFDTGIPASTGGSLFDYAEADPGANPSGLKTFSGPNYGFEVNYSYINTLFLSGATSQSVDALGYQKWSRPDLRKRPRPLYPTFGTTANLSDGANVQLWPSPTNADDCNLYTGSAGAPAPVAANFYVNGYCESSCYTPEQELLFASGYVSILDALKNRREDLMTLSPDATLDSLKLTKGRTEAYTVETRDTKQNIIILATASGGKLSVTDEHPIINGEGRMVQAKTLKVGDELVRSNGDLDPIVSVEQTTHFGKVYNLRPASEELVSNVLVAQGFLVGSSRYQNDDVSYINRIILYSSVPQPTIP
jgi:hypothetical protein